MALLNLEYYITFDNGEESDDIPFTIEMSKFEMAALERAREQSIPFAAYPPLQHAVDRIYETAWELALNYLADTYYSNADIDEDIVGRNDWNLEIRWPV